MEDWHLPMVYLQAQREEAHAGMQETIDIEFTIHTQDPHVVPHLMGQGTILPGRAIALAPDAHLSYLGRERLHDAAAQGDALYSFSLRLPAAGAVEIATTLLWDFLTAGSRAALIPRIGIITRYRTWAIDLRQEEGRREMAAAIQALQADPIPGSLWLGE